MADVPKPDAADLARDAFVDYRQRQPSSWLVTSIWIRRAIAAEAEAAELKRLLSFRGEAIGIAEARVAELERTIAVQQAMIDERERIIKSLCPG